MQIAKVTWIDSYIPSEAWTNKERVSEGDWNCVSVGFLVKNTDDMVVLALSESRDEWGQLLYIPKRAVLDIEYLVL